MAHRRPTFSINIHDRDGDIMDEGVFLYFGDAMIKVADDKEEFAKFVDYLKKIDDEIREML
jgi:hypothetical protein